MNIIEAVILAIVEGLTEFLPVSSTGHMIITSSLLGIQKDEFTKLFEVSIQFGAIGSSYFIWKKIFSIQPLAILCKTYYRRNTCIGAWLFIFR